MSSMRRIAALGRSLSRAAPSTRALTSHAAAASRFSTNRSSSLLRGAISARSFSSSSEFDDIPLLPLFSSEAVRNTIQQGLGKDGYCIIQNFAGADAALKMREEAERLYEEGHMFQSLSNDEQGQPMSKKNVFATELDGNEWDIAPALLDYTRSVLLQAPVVLNYFFPHLQMSQRTYGTKLAVSLGAGAKYPKHCDNSGLPDQRKVTMVYYLNPSWDASQGGELRIYSKNNGVVVVPPVADTLAMFWSDQIVHDVLPTMNDVTNKSERRYALTLWLVSDNASEIVNPKDPLYQLRQTHFPTYGNDY